jgi:hypothetical protein
MKHEYTKNRQIITICTMLLSLSILPVFAMGGLPHPKTTCYDDSGSVFYCPLGYSCNESWDSSDKSCDLPVDGECCSPAGESATGWSPSPSK